MGIVIPPGPSNWTYPPPIDRSFLNSYYSKLTYKETATTEPFDVLISAVANLTRIQGYKFGAEMVEVRVGDVIQPEWTGAENRSVNMYCVACNEGREVWGGIFSACNGYTDSAHRSNNLTVIPLGPSGASHLLYSLSPAIELSTSAVGICFLSLSSPGGLPGYDYTIPFPVTEATRVPHYRFNNSVPTGTADRSISASVTIAAIPQSKSGGGLDKASITGIVIGLVLGVGILVGVAWCCWRRERARDKMLRKAVEEGSLESHMRRRGSNGEDVELQRVERGGVERTIERDEDGEAPPAYHEAIRAGEDERVRRNG